MELRFQAICDSTEAIRDERGREGTFDGPDGTTLRIRFAFVKPGKGRPFLRGEAILTLSTKVRNDVVARWLLAKLFGAGQSGRRAWHDIPPDEAGLAALIERESADLPPGPPIP